MERERDMERERERERDGERESNGWSAEGDQRDLFAVGAIEASAPFLSCRHF